MEEQKIQTITLARKLLFIIIPFFLILVGWFVWQIKNVYFPPKQIHYHAGFIVIKDDKIVDFNDIKYMHTKPCGDDHHERLSSEEEQIEKAHLHDYIDDVVHVHRKNVHWEDLFLNLNYLIDYTKVEAYVNGEKTQNFQTKRIEPYASLVVFIGENDIQKGLNKAVSISHIKEIERKSDNCGS